MNRHRHVLSAVGRSVAIQDHQAFGALVREPFQQRAVHDTEGVCGKAHTQGDRDHCNQRKSGRPEQHPNAVANVLPQHSHISSPGNSAPLRQERGLKDDILLVI